MTWFEDEEWIGSKVTFDHPLSSTWTLVHKLRERELWGSEEEWKSLGSPSEARGIFVCEEEGRPDRQAVVKIYMQYEASFFSLSGHLIPISCHRAVLY